MKDTVGCNLLVITLERSMEMTKHWRSQRSVVMVTSYWTLTIHHWKSLGLSESSQNKEDILWRLWPSRVEYSVIQPPGCADSRGPGRLLIPKYKIGGTHCQISADTMDTHCFWLSHFRSCVYLVTGERRYWPLIGQDWSRDLDSGLWLAQDGGWGK